MNHDAKALVLISNTDLLKTTENSLISQNVAPIIVDSNEEIEKQDSFKTYDFIVLEQDCPNCNTVELVEKIRKIEHQNSIKNQTPIFVLGGDAKKYYSVFNEQVLCKFIKIPVNDQELTSTFINFMGLLGPESEKMISLTKGEYLIQEGSESNEMYWIVSGKFGISKKNASGENIKIAEAYPGELVGEMSFLEGMPRSANVKAIDESEVVMIPHQRFVDLYEDQPLWFRSLIRILSRRLRDASKFIAQHHAHEDTEIELDQNDIDKLIADSLGLK